MLTADLVRTYRRGDRLHVRGINPKQAERVFGIATHLVNQATEGVDQPQREVLAAMGQLDLRANEQKIAAGLRKLVLDRCDFSMNPDLDPPALREAVFLAAAEARRSETFDRLAVLAAVAEGTDLTPEALDKALFADLKASQTLRSFEPITPKQLIDNYELGQSQAVLLRATRVVATVSGATTGAYRALFRALKFRRLLYSIEAKGDGYQITIDGPHSLFTASSKYGLQLALVLPAIRACAAWAIEANVRWGKEKLALVFKDEGAAEAREVQSDLPDDVASLVKRFKRLKTPWRVRRSTRILDLPGVGLCVPDLVFSHPEEGKVYFEVMGFWSRTAVWKRVDLVEAGLKDRVLFAVSRRLRVSEAVLGTEERGALYVYKGSINARGVLDKLNGLVESG